MNQNRSQIYKQLPISERKPIKPEKLNLNKKRTWKKPQVIKSNSLTSRKFISTYFFCCLKNASTTKNNLSSSCYPFSPRNFN